ncbi:hypothetical protein SDC9_169268 [bioreactor metagenome]|uniref:Uncharacterized protein n=1 Tax=bioreactor metagenome TaxID=1076179 RepID=A0A645G6V6_9ZZZZ
MPVRINGAPLALLALRIMVQIPEAVLWREYDRIINGSPRQGNPRIDIGIDLAKRVEIHYFIRRPCVILKPAFPLHRGLFLFRFHGGRLLGFQNRLLAILCQNGWGEARIWSILLGRYLL